MYLSLYVSYMYLSVYLLFSQIFSSPILTMAKEQLISCYVISDQCYYQSKNFDTYSIANKNINDGKFRIVRIAVELRLLVWRFSQRVIWADRLFFSLSKVPQRNKVIFLVFKKMSGILCNSVWISSCGSLLLSIEK